MDWPPQSPDLNPIENLWMRLKNILSRDGRAKKKLQLKERIVRAWYRVITRGELLKLIESIPRRCKMVIASKGGPTKY